MKVLLVSPYPPSRDGLASYAAEMVRRLKDSNDLGILTSVAPSSVASPAEGVYRILAANPLSVLRCVRLMRDFRPQIIHFQYSIAALGLGVGPAMLSVGVARLRYGTRLVFTLHEVRRELMRLGFVGRLLYSAIVRVSDTLIVHTSEARTLLIEQCGAAPRIIRVVPHGVAPPQSAISAGSVDASRAFGGGEDARSVVLYLGYLHPDKGVHHLLAALDILRKRDPAFDRRVRVIIAGVVRPRAGVFRWFERADHRYEQKLRGLVDSGGCGGVVAFTGFVPDEDLIPLIRAARTIVLPYTNVSQSGVGNLALAAGTPVIASDLPGLREPLQDGALYFPTGDVGALADALDRILTDDELHHELQRRARSLRNAQSTTEVAEEVARIYEETVTLERDGSPLFWYRGRPGRPSSSMHVDGLDPPTRVGQAQDAAGRVAE